MLAFSSSVCILFNVLLVFPILHGFFSQSIFDPLHQSGPEFLPLSSPVVAEDFSDQEWRTGLRSNLRLVNVGLKIKVTIAEERQRYL